MTKTIKNVFLIVGTLVLIFLVWMVVFNDGGIVKVGYNALANGINKQWAKVAGRSQKLVPLWDATGANGSNDGGFEIDNAGGV